MQKNDVDAKQEGVNFEMRFYWSSRREELRPTRCDDIIILHRRPSAILNGNCLLVNLYYKKINHEQVKVEKGDYR